MNDKELVAINSSLALVAILIVIIAFIIKENNIVVISNNVTKVFIILLFFIAGMIMGLIMWLTIIDKDSKEQLKGAKFVLCDEDGNEVARWISDEKPYAIEGLSTEKTYFLEEVEAPDGYVLNKEIVELRVEDDTAKEIRIENEKIKPVEEPEKPVEETPKTVKTIQKKLPKTGY